MSRARLKAVFLNLGGEEKLGEILQDFYARMSRDILIGYFFTGKDIQAIATKQKEFLMHAMGVLPTFQGKHPNNAHRELPPILKGHFDRRLVILRETLVDHSLSDQDIRIWIDFENAFRNVIEQ